MEELARVRQSGDLEGDYVVLHRYAGRVLRIAPSNRRNVRRWWR